MRNSRKLFATASAFALIAGTALGATAHVSDTAFLHGLGWIAVSFTVIAAGSCTILAIRMRGRKKVGSVHRAYRML